MKLQNYNIALIGLGSVGKRHLESLIKLKNKTKIYLIDKNVNALKFCEKKICKDVKLHNFLFLSKITDLPKSLDLVIIATNADKRREITEKLIYQTSIRFFIFEKIVFQSNEDFKKIIYFLKKKGIKSWVNCPMRIYPFFKALKKQVKKATLSMVVEGNNWGMASNSVHHLDLFSYLTNKKKFYLLNSSLDKKIYKPKRNFFCEFAGQFTIKSLSGSSIKFKDSMDGTNWPNITISFNRTKFFINQEKNIIKKINIKRKTITKKIKFNRLVQSNLTHKCVTKIFEYGKSELPSLEESYSIHFPLIKLFTKHLSKVRNKYFSKCPIT